MLDRFALGVSDLAASWAFYETALAPLGFGVVMEREGSVAFGPPAWPVFWVFAREPVSTGVHLAFQAADRERSTPFTPPRSRPGPTTTAAPAHSCRKQASLRERRRVGLASRKLALVP
jgi:catechol 2,3-dioxygenase-like lactoylglutathione lyase family enzyme